MKHYSAMETYVATHMPEPKHRLPIPAGTRELRNNATCTCRKGAIRSVHGVCPRHDAPAYADMMARHATDSL